MTTARGRCHAWGSRKRTAATSAAIASAVLPASSVAASCVYDDGDGSGPQSDMGGYANSPMVSQASAYLAS